MTLADLISECFATEFKERWDRERMATHKDELHSRERETKRWTQHSVVTTELVETDDALTEGNTTTKRPGTGIADETVREVGLRAMENEYTQSPVKEGDDHIGWITTEMLAERGSDSLIRPLVHRDSFTTRFHRILMSRRFRST